MSYGDGESNTSAETETSVETAPERARVVHKTPGRDRVIFEGLIGDARKFIENNFPRPHVEPPGSPVDSPTPDAELVKTDGTKETYHADAGWKVS